MTRTPQYGFGVIVAQGIEPQPFDVTDLLDIGVRCVILIVVIQSK